jgi:hypothetical protein
MTHSMPKRAHDRGRRHAVLAGAGFGNNPALSHAFREQDLAKRVVDLVRAGVEQILALQIDFSRPRVPRSGAPRSKAGSVARNSRAADQQAPFEKRISLRFLILVREFD